MKLGHFFTDRPIFAAALAIVIMVIGGIAYAESPYAAAEGADALVICTEWQNFRAPDFDVIKSALKQPVIFDGRNLYDPERLENRGFTYYAIGRGASIKPVI